MDEQQGATLIYMTERGRYAIELVESPEACSDFVDGFLRPLLFAMGYQPETVQEYLPEGPTADEGRMRRVLGEILTEASGDNRRSVFAAEVRRLAKEGLGER